MKKILLSILIIMVISVAACKTAVKETPQVGIPKTEASGSDAAVDAVGNDLTNVNAVEKELSTDGLNDVDSGLNDVDNI